MREPTSPIGFSDPVLVGRGATSRVYGATEIASGRRVALKRLHRQLLRSGDALSRLRRELEALRKIRHPAIVAVRDLIHWDGDPTIVMDFVDGEDLQERLVREGRLPSAEVERIARALLDALATTHASGIVHRDLKPQNIRLDRDGNVRLLDFGSARLDASSQLTTTGTTVGTPEYMAPELFAASTYDPRVDLYGVGATLFECLTGRVPQSADSLAELAYLRLHEDVAPVASLVADVSPALAQLVDRCLCRAPEDRHASARLALFALDHPDAERALRSRRSAHPPCLHCKTPIAPESRDCPACHSDHPFAYAPGGATVVLRSFRDPAELLTYFATLFPERATPSHLLAVAEQLSALGNGGRRWVSGVHPSEAQRIIEELQGVGAHAELVDDATLLGPPILLALALCMLLVLLLVSGARPLVAALTLAMLFIGALVWSAARSSVLATGTHWPKIVSSKAHAVVGILVTWSLVSAAFEFVRSSETFSVPHIVPAVGTVLAALVATSVGRIREPNVRPSMSPQPGCFRAAFAGAPRVEKNEVFTGARAEVSVFALLLVGLMMWLEIVALSQLAPKDWARPGQHSVTRTEYLASAPPVTTRSTSTAPSTPAFDWTPYLPALAITLLIPWLIVRRRRVRADGAEIFSTLDLSAFAHLAARTPPVTRSGQATSTTAASASLARVATLRPGDAFWADAVRRSVDLMHVLPSEAGARLTTSLEALAQQKPLAGAEQSLVSRCVLEADPDQKARFAFLALEGELEAEAAIEWQARTRGRS